MAGRADGVDEECAAAGQTCVRPRFRSTALNLTPFRSAHPGQLPDGTMDFSQVQLSPTTNHQRSGHISPLRTVRTIREYDEQIENLQKENFNLKLRLYFLEQSVDKKFNKDAREHLKVNVQLKIETETLKKDLAQKTQLLQDALVLIDKQEEKHKEELGQAKEVQEKLEEKVKNLQQDIEKLISTPRSSDGDSEYYKQAFGIDESAVGKPSCPSEKDIEEMKLQFESKIEKLRGEVETKDKEIKKMKDDILILENKNKLLEEKIRKRNIAIQGMYQMIHKKHAEPPKETLYETLACAIDAANSGDMKTVKSMMNAVVALMNELLPRPDSKVSICLSSDLADLKSEVLRRDEIIKALEKQLLEQAQRSSGKTPNPYSDNIALEKECGKLQRAVREKDLLIQELLNERTNIASEHQKTVESFLSKWENRDISEQLANEEMKIGSLQESESLKMLQELISEKDAEIDLRKKAIDLLDTQLIECRQELQNSVDEAREKDFKLLEMSNHSHDLEKQLTTLQQQFQELKASYASEYSNPTIESSNSCDKKEDNLKSNENKIDNHQLINFDESLKANTTPTSEKNGILTDSHDLHLKEKNFNVASKRFGDETFSYLSDTLAPSDAKSLSKTILLDASGKDKVKLSLQVKMSEREEVNPEKMLQMMEHDIETSQQADLTKQLVDKHSESNKLCGNFMSITADSSLKREIEQLNIEVQKKESLIAVLTSELSDLQNEMMPLLDKLHKYEQIIRELKKIGKDSKVEILSPTTKPESYTDHQEAEKPSSNLLPSLSNTISSTESQSQSLLEFGHSNSVNDLKEEIWLLTLTIEQKEKELKVHKQKITDLEENAQNLSVQNQNYNKEISALHKTLMQSQEISDILLQRLEELSKFFQSAVKFDKTGKLDTSSLSPESLTRFLKFVDSSMELSQDLSQNLALCEESKLFDLEEVPEKTFDNSSNIQTKEFKPGQSLQKDESFTNSATEGRGFQSSHQEEQLVYRAGKRRRWSYSLQQKLTSEHIVKPFNIDQYAVGTSDNEDISLLLNEQGISENVFSQNKVTNPEENSMNAQTEFLLDTVGFESNAVDTTCDTMNNSNFSDYVYDQNFCWNEDLRYINSPYPNMPPENVADIVVPFVPNNQGEILRGGHCISSDSDIWSEPDRNISLQRIGIEIKMPILCHKSPRKHRPIKDKLASSDPSSKKSPSVNCTSKGKPFRQRFNSGQAVTHAPTGQAYESIIESHLQSFEQSMDDKLSHLFELFQNIQANISDLSELRDKSTTDPQILEDISEGIQNLQSTLTDAVNDVKVLKEKSKGSYSIQNFKQIQDLQSYFNNVIEKMNDADELKYMLMKELLEKKAGEIRLQQSKDELDALKKQLKGITFNAPSDTVNQQQEYEDKFTGFSQDIEFLNVCFARERELTAVLNKQISHLQNENTKLKSNCERLRNLLSNREKHAEEIANKSISVQKSVKELKKRILLGESKSSGLISDVECLESIVTSEVEQNEWLKKRVNDLSVQNKKLEGEVQQMQIDLQSEKDQLEIVSRSRVEECESLKKTVKDKQAAEANIANLKTTIENLESSILKEEERSSCLSKQVNELLNGNRKLSQDIEQLNIRFKSQTDHFEVVNKERNDFHKEKLTLSTEKNELGKKLEYQEELVKQMTDTKIDMNKKLLETNRQIIALNEQIQILESEKELLEKEVNQFKANLSTADTLCDELKYDLKQTKEKLKKIELKCKQYENDLTKTSVTNNNLEIDKKSLKVEVESKTNKLMELNKDIFDIKELVKDLKNTNKEMEREKTIVSDELENLKANASYIASSNEKVICENKDLNAKLSSLEVQLRNSELALQSSKDENEHAKLQLINLQNKIKRKESVVKELEGQSDALQDQLKDQELNLKKGAIDIKHLEDENYSLQQQLHSLKKHIEKHENQLELKDSKMDQLKEKFFDLEQHIKDGETVKKIMEDEKRQAQSNILKLEVEIQKQEDFQKKLKLEKEMLEGKVADLQKQLLSKDVLKKKFEDEKLSLVSIIDEKEESLKKLETNSKKMEGKLATVHCDVLALQEQVRKLDTAKKLAEDEVESARRELSRLKIDRQSVSTKGTVSSDRLSTMENQLKHKEQYCKTLETKVNSYYNKIIKLQNEIEKGSLLSSHLSTETKVKPREELDMPFVLKEISDKNTSHENCKITIDKLKNDINTSLGIMQNLQLSNDDLKLQVSMLTEKLILRENLKTVLEKERESLFGQISEYGKTSSVLEMEEILHEIQIYAEQIRKLENQVEQKNTFIRDIKQELFEAHNLLLSKQEQIETMEAKIKNYEVLLLKLQFDKEQLERQPHTHSDHTAAQLKDHVASESDVLNIAEGNKEAVLLKRQISEPHSMSGKNRSFTSVVSSTPIPSSGNLYVFTNNSIIDDHGSYKKSGPVDVTVKELVSSNLDTEMQSLEQLYSDDGNLLSVTQTNSPKHDDKYDMLRLIKERDYFKDLVKNLQKNVQLNAFQTQQDIPSQDSKPDFNEQQKEDMYSKNLVQDLKVRLPERKSPSQTVMVKAVPNLNAISGEHGQLDNELPEESGWASDSQRKLSYFPSPEKTLFDNNDDKYNVIRLQKERDYFKNLVESLSKDVHLDTFQTEQASHSKSCFDDLQRRNVYLKMKLPEKKLPLETVRVEAIPNLTVSDRQLDSRLLEKSEKTNDSRPKLSCSFGHKKTSFINDDVASKLVPVALQVVDDNVTKDLEDRIEELETELEDCRMENYQLHDNMRMFLQDFGFQNNTLVCKKCGKSDSLTSFEQLPSREKSKSVFTSLYEYASKTSAFHPEEHIRKLSECKWNLQNEVLELQKNLLMSNSSLLRRQEIFNKRIMAMTSDVQTKPPTKVWSEPAVVISSSSHHPSKFFQKFEFLWKNFLLYTQLDIECLQNYRSFLKHYVKGFVIKSSTLKNKGSIEHLRRKHEEKTLPSEQRLSDVFHSQEPQHLRISLSDHTFEIPQSFAEQTYASSIGEALEEGPLSIHDNQEISSEPFLVEDGLSDCKKNSLMKELKLKSEDIYHLKLKVKELDNRIEVLQLENKELRKQLRQVHVENKKTHRSRTGLGDASKEKQLQKCIDDLKHRLVQVESLNKSMKLELHTQRLLCKGDDSSKEPSPETETTRKTLLLKLLEEIKSLGLEVQHVHEENNFLRRKLQQQAAMQANNDKSGSSALPIEEDSSSDKESVLSTDGTVTLSRSASASQASIDSLSKLQDQKPKTVDESTFIEPCVEEGNELGIQDQKIEDIAPPSTSLVIDSAFQRSHFSSPDLGIESDPNHELQTAEYEGQYERIQPQHAIQFKKVVESVHKIMDQNISSTVETSLHAISSLQDYELLKKEVDESMVGLKHIHSRAADFLKHFLISGSPIKNLGYSILKEILSCCSDVDVCMQEIKHLVNKFWVSSFPVIDEKNSFGTLLLQNQQLCQKLSRIQERMKKQAFELKDATERHRAAKKHKEVMEKALFKQLSKTNRCLELAKSNLSEKEQKTQLLLQFSCGKVSLTLPSAEPSLR